MTNLVYNEHAKTKKNSERIAFSISFGGALIALIFQSFSLLALGVGIGFAYYYFAWIQKQGNIAADIKNALHRQADTKRARLENRKKPTATQQEEAFSEPLTENPASVFDSPRRR